MIRQPWARPVGRVPGVYLEQVVPYKADKFLKAKAHAQKQPFSSEEDRKITEFVKANGAKNWNLVASELNTRTPKQCRERWHNHLDPSIEKGPWTPEEDQILAEKQVKLGNKWAEIARFLPGRTDTLVKNRWNTSVRNRVLYDGRGNVTVICQKPPPRFPEQKSSVEISQWLEQFASAKPVLPVGEATWIPPLVLKDRK